MRWDDDDPGLPIKFGPCANDEYDPVPLSAVVREAIRRAREQCDDNARRTGVSRRRFLLSACAAATTLLALDACTSEAAKHRGQAKPGGRYQIPPEATTEPSVANGALGGHEFIFDVQNHLLDYSMDPRSRDEAFFGADFPQARCGEADPHDCFSVDHFLEQIFLKSDTSMAVVSSLPIRPEHSAESIQVRDKAQQVARAVCHDDRLLIQGEAHPTLYPLPDALAAMEQMANTYTLSAWKVYTHQPGPPWWLDDHDASLAPVGEAFIRKAVELGIPRICVHKGLVGGRFASPIDIGPAARTHPDVAFVVYHSGYDIGGPEGAFTPATANIGVNRLITSMQQAGIGPNQNVYAELGTTWYRLPPTSSASSCGTSARTTCCGEPTRSGTDHPKTRSRRFEPSRSLPSSSSASDTRHSPTWSRRRSSDRTLYACMASSPSPRHARSHARTSPRSASRVHEATEPTGHRPPPRRAS